MTEVAICKIFISGADKENFVDLAVKNTSVEAEPPAPSLKLSIFDALPEIQPPAAAPYVTVPVSRDSHNEEPSHVLPWVEPLRVKQSSALRLALFLEYDPESPRFYVFPCLTSHSNALMLIKPRLPVPPGLFYMRDGCTAIMRHEVPYSCKPTVPIPGHLSIKPSKDLHVEPSQLYLEFKAGQCPNFYLSNTVTVVISASTPEDHSPSGFSILLPSEEGEIYILCIIIYMQILFTASVN